MEQLLPIGIFLFVLFLLLGTGVWIGLALLGVAWVGMELFTMRPAGDAMMTVIWRSASSWTLTALPLFIWMGEILYRTRLSEDMFKGLSPWMARLPGGLLHTNVVGCTVFAAVSGSSAATLTTVGKMSIPELRKRNYPENLVIGTLASAATLGLMIPPSLTLIVYGVTINESITKLFIAGIVPGLVLAAMFMLYVVAISRFSPNYRPDPEPPMSFSERVSNSRFLIPVLLLILVVIGSMYLGYAPATEAAKEAYREHIGYHLAGADQVEGTHPLTHARSQAAFRINSFLHDLIKPAHRDRFRTDFDALAAERGLTDEEIALIKGRKWIEMIHYGVSFFMLEKMAAVLGVPNPEVYAAFRGETLEEFQKSRKVAITYGVGGGDKAKALNEA